MRVLVRQSTLNALGLGSLDFLGLSWRDRRNVAARCMAAEGNTSVLSLLELNNQRATAGIEYVADAPAPQVIRSAPKKISRINPRLRVAVR